MASYNLVYGNLLSVPGEITAICVLFQYWTDINSSLWIIIFIIMTFSVGMTYIGIYGEVEYWFAILKVVFIVSLQHVHFPCDNADAFRSSLSFLDS